MQVGINARAKSQRISRSGAEGPAQAEACPTTPADLFQFPLLSWESGYSCIEGWLSDSRQALIFRRRQTQQRASVENGATSPPQITHLPRFVVLCGVIGDVPRRSVRTGPVSDGMTRGFLRFIV
jgi:hypothetical protein